MSTSITKQGMLKADGSDVGENILRNTGISHVSNEAGTYATGTWKIGSGGNGTGHCTYQTGPSPYIFGVYDNTSGNRDWIQRGAFVNIGEIYTISGYVRVASVSQLSSVKMLVRMWDYVNGNANQCTLSKTISNIEWEHFSKTFIYNGGVTSSNVIDADAAFGISGAGSIEYCAIKLEKGSIATPWTPSPKDDIYTRDHGFFEGSNIASIGKGYFNANEFYEL